MAFVLGESGQAAKLSASRYAADATVQAGVDARTAMGERTVDR